MSEILETVWDVVLVVLAGVVVLMIAGCGMSPKVPDVVHVRVPVACLKPGQVRDPPAIKPDAELARLDDYDLVRTIAAERADLAAWAAIAAPVLKACEQP